MIRVVDASSVKVIKFVKRKTHGLKSLEDSWIYCDVLCDVVKSYDLYKIIKRYDFENDHFQEAIRNMPFLERKFIIVDRLDIEATNKAINKIGEKYVTAITLPQLLTLIDMDQL